MDKALSSGAIHVTWTSLNLDSFIAKANSAITEFERFVKQVIKFPVQATTSQQRIDLMIVIGRCVGGGLVRVSHIGTA